VGMWVWFWINKNINFLIFFYIRFNFGGINFKFLKLKLNWIRIFNQQRNIRCWFPHSATEFQQRIIGY
jgi:hypothetical protein